MRPGAEVTFRADNRAGVILTVGMGGALTVDCDGEIVSCDHADVLLK